MDLLRHTANLIEEHGHFRLRRRDRLKGVEIELSIMLQFEDKAQALEFGLRYRRKVYGFHHVFVVYLVGKRLALLLAASLEYFCPAHRRLAVLVLQMVELSRQRQWLGRARRKNTLYSREQIVGFAESSGKKGTIKDQLFREAWLAYGAMPNECPTWQALGGPFQRNMRAWFAENRPAENALYWKSRGGS